MYTFSGCASSAVDICRGRSPTASICSAGEKRREIRGSLQYSAEAGAGVCGVAGALCVGGGGRVTFLASMYALVVVSLLAVVVVAMRSYNIIVVVSRGRGICSGAVNLENGCSNICVGVAASRQACNHLLKVFFPVANHG